MKYPVLLLSFLVTAAQLGAEVHLASPFGNHMVLQRGQPIPIWGTATPGEKVTVQFAGRKQSATADAGGHWRVNLKKLQASAESRVLTVTGSTTPTPLVLTDVLVGEVWLCGGQSNMERQLGPRPGQPLIVDWQQEVAAAHHPLIRQLYVHQTRASSPQSSVAAEWTVCSPATVADFTAVGYFFARDLQARLGVPVGIIHSSWGGTPSEAWTSRAGLAAFPEFADELAAVAQIATDPATARRNHTAKIAAWFQANDTGSGDQPWSAPDLETSAWETMNLPTQWEQAGHAGFDGVAWFRRNFDVPVAWAGRDLVLRFGGIDDADTTWVNGVEVGATNGWSTPRAYHVPASTLHPIGNVIAVRVLDTMGNGGIWQPPLTLAPAEGGTTPLALTGPWLARFSTALTRSNRPPSDGSQNAGTPTGLYNGMIAPLVPYAIRGVAFYQGEANALRATQYRTLFPALIADWRLQWHAAELPFLFVQIAPFKEQPPEIREAQFLSWQATPHTALIVTLDCGDANDIHPAHKQPVGARLALAARALAYGEKVEYSGPAYTRLHADGHRAVLAFSHLGGGLVVKTGPLTGFTIAGADGVFHPATAAIAGETVVVSSPEVAAPAAVRYAWANVAAGNLFNQVGLPASPFRTDVR